MRPLSAYLFATLLFFTVADPVQALPNGKELYSECTRSDSFSAGYCEGFVIGVLSAHMSPWVVHLQKGKIYFCIPGSLTFKEITDVVRKYLAENPQRQRYRADTSIWTAMTEVFPCDEQK